jgi:hypothetical protein
MVVVVVVVVVMVTGAASTVAASIDSFAPSTVVPASVVVTIDTRSFSEFSFLF